MYELLNRKRSLLEFIEIKITKPLTILLTNQNVQKIVQPDISSWGTSAAW
jgi:hypothetical protein